MSVEALLAILSAGAGISLVIGLPRIVSTDMRWLDVRLRRYGARPFELKGCGTLSSLCFPACKLRRFRERV